MHNSGTFVATVPPEDVVVIIAPAVVHVEVVMVWTDTPAGTAVSVVVMPSMEPCELVVSPALKTELVVDGAFVIPEVVPWLLSCP